MASDCVRGCNGDGIVSRWPPRREASSCRPSDPWRRLKSLATASFAIFTLASCSEGSRSHVESPPIPTASVVASAKGPIEASSDYFDEAIDCSLNKLGISIVGSRTIEQMISTSLQECAIEFDLAKRRMVADGYSQHEANQRANLNVRSIREVLGDEIASIQSAERTLVAQSRYFYNQTRICSAKLAIDYKEIAQKDNQIFSSLAHRECDGDHLGLFDAFQRASYPTETIAQLIAILHSCSVYSALSAIDYLSSADKDRWQDVCNRLWTRLGASDYQF